jgi:ABC-type branched-subunit amino acid transport system permease subunit
MHGSFIFQVSRLYGNKSTGKEKDMTLLLQELIVGLTTGAIYALIALGYTMVYGIIELINFAHGDIFMIGTLVSIAIFGVFGITNGTGRDWQSCWSDAGRGADRDH